MDNLFRAILHHLQDLDGFVRSQRYVLRRRSRGVQRSGFEIGFWVVTTDPEFWHLDAPLNVSESSQGRRRGRRRAREVRVALFQCAVSDVRIISQHPLLRTWETKKHQQVMILVGLAFDVPMKEARTS